MIEVGDRVSYDSGTFIMENGKLVKCPLWTGTVIGFEHFHTDPNNWRKEFTTVESSNNSMRAVVELDEDKKYLFTSGGNPYIFQRQLKVIND